MVLENLKFLIALSLHHIS